MIRSLLLPLPSLTELAQIALMMASGYAIVFFFSVVM